MLRLRHADQSYLVQCRASYDVTRSPSVTSHCYKLASAVTSLHNPQSCRSPMGELAAIAAGAKLTVV